MKLIPKNKHQHYIQEWRSAIRRLRLPVSNMTKLIKLHHAIEEIVLDAYFRGLGDYEDRLKESKNGT